MSIQIVSHMMVMYVRIHEQDGFGYTTAVFEDGDKYKALPEHTLDDHFELVCGTSWSDPLASSAAAPCARRAAHMRMIPTRITPESTPRGSRLLVNLHLHLHLHPNSKSHSLANIPPCWLVGDHLSCAVVNKPTRDVVRVCMGECIMQGCLAYRTFLCRIFQKRKVGEERSGRGSAT